MKKTFSLTQDGKKSMINLPEGFDKDIPIYMAIDTVYDMGDLTAKLIDMGMNSYDIEFMVNIAKDYYFKGRKIESIKFIRALTHWGLKETKDFVEDNFQVT